MEYKIALPRYSFIGKIFTDFLHNDNNNIFINDKLFKLISINFHFISMSKFLKLINNS